MVTTRPSDTFTFGDKIKVSTKDVTAFTGRSKELDYLNRNGVKTVTSQEANNAWNLGVSDFIGQAARIRPLNRKIFELKKAGEITLKTKYPVDRFKKYASTIEDLSRTSMKSPTLKDYKFMDYVF